jgi:hypothetical protein
MSTMTTTSRGSSPGRGDWKETLGRIGIAGKGVLFTVIGIMAIQLAAGDVSRANATNQGAIEWIASQPLGQFLLVALTVSLFALAAWRLLDAAVGDPVEGSEPSARAKYAVKGLLYLSLAAGALTTTIAAWNSSDGQAGGQGGGAQASGGGRQQATATVLEWPAGQWIVAAIGLGVIGYAFYVFKAQTMDEKFLERIAVAPDSWVAKLGRFGYAARSVVYVVIGYFLLQAGITYEAGQTKGLSGALQEISGKGWGQWVLWGVALGLFAYGLFTLAEAKYRRAA